MKPSVEEDVNTFFDDSRKTTLYVYIFNLYAFRSVAFHDYNDPYWLFCVLNTNNPIRVS